MLLQFSRKERAVGLVVNRDAPTAAAAALRGFAVAAVGRNRARARQTLRRQPDAAARAAAGAFVGSTGPVRANSPIHPQQAAHHELHRTATGPAPAQAGVAAFAALIGGLQERIISPPARATHGPKPAVAAVAPAATRQW